LRPVAAHSIRGHRSSCRKKALTPASMAKKNWFELHVVACEKKRSMLVVGAQRRSNKHAQRVRFGQLSAVPGDLPQDLALLSVVIEWLHVQAPASVQVMECQAVVRASRFLASIPCLSTWPAHPASWLGLLHLQLGRLLPVGSRGLRAGYVA
jgi:hypothetical protein